MARMTRDQLDKLGRLVEAAKPVQKTTGITTREAVQELSAKLNKLVIEGNHTAETIAAIFATAGNPVSAQTLRVYMREAGIGRVRSGRRATKTRPEQSAITPSVGGDLNTATDGTGEGGTGSDGVVQPTEDTQTPAPGVGTFQRRPRIGG